MKTHIEKLLPIALAAALVACGDDKNPSDGQTDTTTDEAGDGSDAADVTEDPVPDSAEDPSVEDVEEEGDGLPDPPSHVLEYLGRYEHQADGPDHLLASTLVDAGPLVAASPTGIAVVDSAAVETGTVTAHMGKYLVDTGEASNLDGAPAGGHYFPKFFHVEASGSAIYASTRYDGLWTFELGGSGSAWSVTERDRHLRAREFTEGIQVVGDRLYVAHHADGLEVMDISSDPLAPASLDVLGDPLVDVWGMYAQPDGKIWVADGIGGLKLVRNESDTLAHITGDVLTTAPGAVLDATVIGDWVVAAVAGQGITVYEEWSAAQRNTYPLPGVCVDVERMSDERVAVACRGWVHVVEVNALGIATVLASARMHRRLDGSDASVHIASHVHVDGDTLYVSGWDHLDVYRLAETSTDPDIHVSAQRAHFGSPPGVAWFLVENAGQGTLEISEVTCTATGITCPIDATTIPPGGSATLRVVSDGSGDDVEALVGIVSNDPDDPEVPVIVLAALADAVDPLEEAPDFTGPTVLWDYDAGTFTDATLTLSEIDTAGEVAHFAIFGTWCPACMPVVVAMEPDVGDVLPTGARFFLVAQGEPDSVVEHVLEKIRIPVEVFLDGDESVGAGLYDQPRVGVPFGRAYVIDSDGFVTDVFAGYAPDDVNDAIDDAL